MNYTKLEAIVAGTTYDIDDLVSILHQSSDGFGMPPVERLVSRGPRQHGHTDEGFLLGARSITLVEVLLADSYANLFARRKTILEIFKPSNAPILIRFTLPDSSQRQLDCHFSADLRLPFGSRDVIGYNQRVAVQLVAPNPTFYDPVQKQEVWGVSGASSNLVFPITFSIQFTSSILNEGRVLAYVGTWETYPVIRLTGPLQNPRVTNVSTDEKIEMAFTIPTGKYVDIDLSPGAKTVIDSDGVNRLGTLSTDSDLATWHLAADPEVADGDNTIKVEAGGATQGVSGVTISYYARYIGV